MRSRRATLYAHLLKTGREVRFAPIHVTVEKSAEQVHRLGQCLLGMTGSSQSLE